MSLINKMLQDLERRHKAPELVDESVFGELHSAPTSSRWRRGPWVALALLVVAGAAAGTFVQRMPVSAAPVAAAQAPPPQARPTDPKAGIASAIQTAALEVAVAVAAPELPVEAAAKPVEATQAAQAQIARQEAPKAAQVQLPWQEAPIVPVVAALPLPAPAAAPVEAVAPRPEAATSLAPTPASPDKLPSQTLADKAPAPAARLQSQPPISPGQTQKSFSPQQQSENLLKQALVHMQQGRAADARESLRRSLEANPKNADALQLLAGLLVEGKNIDEALSLLQEGNRLMPEQSGLSMLLARLQTEKGDNVGAMLTLERGLRSAANDPQYHAFYAALLQRAARHDEAVAQYLLALQTDPSMPNWLVGIGISLHAVQKDQDAEAAFRRAKDGGLLPPSLTEFVDQRLSQLRR